MASMLHAALDNVAPTRRKILEHIKKQGESRAEEIASHLLISVQGTRQHLAALERDGLIRHHEQRDGLGRPKFVYTLTAGGDALFPRNYPDLTNEILEYVEDEDPELLQRIFQKRAHLRLERARARLDGLTLHQRVQVLAEILDEDGYLADFQDRGDGSFLIREHNCAVLSVAVRHQQECTSELAFLKAALPDAEVTRVAHRIAGGHICAYVVKPVNGRDRQVTGS